MSGDMDRESKASESPPTQTVAVRREALAALRRAVVGKYGELRGYLSDEATAAVAAHAARLAQEAKDGR